MSNQQRWRLAAFTVVLSGVALGVVVVFGRFGKQRPGGNGMNDIRFTVDEKSEGAGPKPATEHTRKANAAFARTLPFADKWDFDEAKKGLIAPLPGGGVVKNTDGRVVWDLGRYNFIEMDEAPPDTVNPSLWRQAQLLSLTGLFQVTDRIYQVRGYDISNITFIEGKDGVTVVDPLTSRETAKAALDLYYQHRPKKPVVAVIHTHSHVDHYGGVRGVVSEEDVKAGKVKVIAPEHFTAEVVSENVLAGNAMNRRALYMQEPLLPPGPQVQAGHRAAALPVRHHAPSRSGAAAPARRRPVPGRDRGARRLLRPERLLPSLPAPRRRHTGAVPDAHKNLLTGRNPLQESGRPPE
jgi:hypothetical protein